jgi:hypothetical protein
VHHLRLHAAALKVANPLKLGAIAAAKKENDRIDANKICDACPVIFCRSVTWPPRRLANTRRMLRYRNLLMRSIPGPVCVHP